MAQHRKWTTLLASIVAKLDHSRIVDAATLQSLYIVMYDRCSLLKRLIGNPKFQELAMQLHIKDRFVSNVTCTENDTITFCRARQRFVSLFKPPLFSLNQKRCGIELDTNKLLTLSINSRQANDQVLGRILRKDTIVNI